MQLALIDLPFEPTIAKPGSPEKLAEMQWRLEHGLPLFHANDATGPRRYSTAWNYVEQMVESREFREDEFPDLDNEPSE